MFASVTEKFTDIVGTIEQFGDVSKMTVPEAIERLRTHEENRKGKKQTKDDREKLLYTRAELEAQFAKERRKKEGISNSGGRGGSRVGKGRGGVRSQGSGRNDTEKFIDDRRPCDYEKSKVKCFNCNLFGHFVNECRKPDKR